MGHRAECRRTEDRRQKAEDKKQRAVWLSVISYLLFGRSVDISWTDDFYDLNDLNDLPLTAYRLPFDDLTNLQSAMCLVLSA